MSDGDRDRLKGQLGYVLADILRTIDRTVNSNPKTLGFTVGIGLVMFPIETDDPPVLLHNIPRAHGHRGMARLLSCLLAAREKLQTADADTWLAGGKVLVTQRAGKVCIKFEEDGESHGVWHGMGAEDALAVADGIRDLATQLVQEREAN